MKENISKILENNNKKGEENFHFHVPNNYFDQLESNIISSTNSININEKDNANKTYYSIILEYIFLNKRVLLYSLPIILGFILLTNLLLYNNEYSISNNVKIENYLLTESYNDINDDFYYDIVESYTISKPLKNNKQIEIDNYLLENDYMDESYY